MKSPYFARFVITAVAFLPVMSAQSDDRETATSADVDSMRGEIAGRVRDDNGLKTKLVWCPPGIFRMGDFKRVVDVVEQSTAMDDDEYDDVGKEVEAIAKETPAVKVFLRRGYWLGRYEVTQAEWKQVMTKELWKGKRFAKEGDDLPAAYVSWNDAMKFCSKLTEQERQAGRLPVGWEYTLPTEAQWEFACRARTGNRLPQLR